MDDASTIVSRCLETEPKSQELISLTFDIREERQSLSPELDAKLDAFTNEGVQAMDPERRRPFAETLLRRRLRSLKETR